jgi:hypothetical protein
VSKEQYITINPRDFIMSPFIQCPQCRRDSFGVLIISDDSYTRRCRECWHTQRFRLPALQKKIIYIDQFAISKMMKALNPETSAHQKGRVEPVWVSIFEKLDSLCKLQLIICPDSSAHINESRVSSYFQALQRMYELLSHGVSFYDPETIKRIQMREHLENWIAGNPNTSLTLDAHSVTHGSLNGWQDRLIISARIPWKQEWIEELREGRDQLHEEIKIIFARWQTETDKNFDYWFEQELASFGIYTLQAYQNEIMKFAQIQSGQREMTMNDLSIHKAVIMIQMIKAELRRAGVSEPDIWPKTLEYLASPSLRIVPFQKISSMLWAAIARKAKSGKKEPPNRGMVNDIDTISTLLPYCDAMVIDNECRGYLNEQPLLRELDFGTKLFSEKNKQEFLDYLDEIKSTASPEHLELIKVVYGEGWEMPYTTLYLQNEE